MITLTAGHPKRASRPGKLPCQELGGGGQAPSQPSLTEAPKLPAVSPEQLAERARNLANSHVLASVQGGDRLLVRLDESARVLQEAYHRLKPAVDARRTVAPAGVWLVENFNRIQELIRTAGRDLSKGQCSELPQLADDSGEGLPRVFHLSQELIDQCAARLDQESLHHFFGAYQAVSPLSLGELWSVCGMLRLGLIEFLCRVATRVSSPSEQDVPCRDPLPERDDVGPEAVDELSMKHGILSLRDLAVLDWKGFVERQSAVERILQEDPAGIHPRMSFAGRDHYRRIVQRLAVGSALCEEEVARAAIELARQSPPASESSATAAAGGRVKVEQHVGYYLVDGGRPALEAKIGYHLTPRAALGRLLKRAPMVTYLGAILLVWLVAVIAAAAVGARLEIVRIAGPAAALVLLALFAGAAGRFAVSIVNWLCQLLLPPRPMMRMDFSAGIPAEHRALVAVPALLTSEQGVRDLMEQIELRYLANQDDNLSFALLSDFRDADQETVAGDSRLLELAREEIQRLNQRYCADRSGIFYLLHRPRKWNRQQGKWMSEERKRGKLAALNRLLRTGAADAFCATIGDLPQLRSNRYVITLDSDTRLPRDTARQLVGCAAHPLNQARIDPHSRTVTAGYAVLQPRVTATMPEAHRSPYSRLSAGDAGIDPYTLQTSDLYQDLFGQGSFIGKGIYDVEAFESVCEGRFPENRLLSHDLIEGCFARSGLVNDVELFEGVPARLLADMKRRHRWIRGDWQIASWLGSRVPALQGSEANPLSGLSRWKILDNLGRSLTPALLLSFLVLGWLLAPALAGTVTLMALALVFVPSGLAALPGMLRRPEGKPWMLHASDQARRYLRTLLAEAMGWCILPYTVHSNLDAVLRTLFRLGVSHRKLLEWATASEVEASCSGKLRDHYKTMAACTASSVLVAAALLLVQPWALLVAGPVLLAWLAGPWIAWRVSVPYPCDAIETTQAEKRSLGRWARQSWHYFEIFAGKADHWLPPDNAQGDPPKVVAARTSPTNIGLALLSGLTAYDLGYVPAAVFLGRTRRTLQSMRRLERYRGHFYNWYNTRTLQPSEPRYVSSVDSGNLWGALTVLGAGMEELRNRPLLPPRLFEGLQDTVEVIAELRRPPTSDPIDDCIAGLRAECRGGSPSGARQTCRRLRRIRRRAADLVRLVPADQLVLKHWSQVLVRQAAQAHRHLSRLAFWTNFTLPDDGLQAELPCPPPASPASRRPHAARFYPTYTNSKRQRGLESNAERRQGIGLATSLATAQEEYAKKQDVKNIEQCAELTQLLAWFERLDAGCTLGQLLEAAEQCAEGQTWRLDAAAEYESGRDHAAEEDAGRGSQAFWTGLRQAAREAALAARKELRQIDSLTELCRQFSAMDYRFLYHPQRKLLTIGFNVTERRSDDSYYDLLASEARLTSFLAVSHNQLPLEHWFALGRVVTMVSGTPTLLSWSGSMFEYLMPALIMPSCRESLLNTTCRAAVKHQIRYAGRHGIPWGISESCSSVHPSADDYDYGYRAFGVPGLGLAPDLDKHLVIAPYAAALALLVAPREACGNLARLERLGYLSSYGFYDAIDHTAELSRSGSPPQPCKIVMAHHSGMTLLALSHALLGPTMPNRFLRNPPCAAHEILLEERVPQNACPVNPILRNPA